MKAAKATIESYATDLKELRRQLADELDSFYGINPAALDVQTLELLRSGVLTPGEYEKLMREAQAADNGTMTQIIGRFAKREAEALSAKYGQDDDDARRLRAVSSVSIRSTGIEQLRRFDYLIDAYNRTVRTPSMISSWDKIVADAVKNV